ncbi:MAG: DUF2799 domain-containing protein [Pseudomonadota bacterium]
MRRALQGVVLAVLAVSAIGLVGCASYFKRKTCEKTNWFDHGYKRAMKGKRLEGDDFLKQCEKVEAKIDYGEADRGFKAGMGNYCKPKTVYSTGRNGEFFNENLCDGGGLKKLKAQHAKGVRELCQPKNGKQKGATGWKYNNICPTELEEGFMSTYREGRKIYLEGLVKQKRQEIRSLDKQVRELNVQKAATTTRLLTMRRSKETKTVKRYDAKKGRYVTKKSSKESEESQRRRRDLESEISGFDRRIRDARTKQEKLRAEITQLETEAKAL